MNMNKKENVKSPIRVAAYCRTAGSNLDQKNSIEAQKKFLAERIDSTPNWELVAIYVDQGKSGTSTKGRVQFNNMIADANVNKKIDLIITTDLSRFSRNIMDTLTHFNELIFNGVNVFFVNDNTNAMEFMKNLGLPLRASLAKYERRKISGSLPK